MMTQVTTMTLTLDEAIAQLRRGANNIYRLSWRPEHPTVVVRLHEGILSIWSEEKNQYDAWVIQEQDLYARDWTDESDTSIQ